MLFTSLYKSTVSLSVTINNKLQHIPMTVKGILLALISTALFVVVGVLVRKLSTNIDIFQILLFRQITFVALLSPVIVANFSLLLRPRHVQLHIFRIIGAFLALYLGFLTISHIPFADAIALGFTQVLFVAVISRLFLDEKVGIHRLITILIGFIGVLFVVQPSFSSGNILYTFSGLLGALGAAIAVVCLRKMSQTESRISLLSYQALFLGLIALIPSLINWHWPSSIELILLLSVGIISSLAQWVGITAYKWAEANIIANVEYAKIIYSLLFGYYLFAEVPNSLAIIGSIVIIASALLPVYFSRQNRR